MPYATKLLDQEMTSFLSMGLRFVTSAGVTKLKNPTNEFFSTEVPTGPQEPLRERVVADIQVARILPAKEPPKIEDLQAQAELAGMTLVPKADPVSEPVPETNPGVEPALEGMKEFSEPEGTPERTPEGSIVGMPEITQGVIIGEGEGEVLPSAVPGAPPVISIATDDAAMGADGLAATDRLIKSFSVPIESVSLGQQMAAAPGMAPARRTLRARNNTSPIAPPATNIMGGGAGTRTIVVNKTG
jgi:hypothetical protein